ncbi:MAG: hypothetical protein LBT12_00690 [Oscillospiraceae bacterium]|jgi:aspartyl/glutamyl-tRNA(Asn/Gln) amidotransferase C subunit|nr:hypothetical protein [Oscillospiraceae bacterium]
MITYGEMKKLAALARLSLDGADVEALTADIGDILAFADQIAGADLSKLDTGGDAEAYPLREDAVLASLPPEELLRNAGETRDNFFVARTRGGLV